MTGERVKRISIAEDFSKYPAGRFPEDGDYNGTTFRDEILVIALRDPSIDVVEVVFDGVAGFGSSFLEEAFGGLIRELGMEKVELDERLVLLTTESDLDDYVSLSRQYIEEAETASEK